MHIFIYVYNVRLMKYVRQRHTRTHNHFSSSWECAEMGESPVDKYNLLFSRSFATRAKEVPAHLLKSPGVRQKPFLTALLFSLSFSNEEQQGV